MKLQPRPSVVVPVIAVTLGLALSGCSEDPDARAASTPSDLGDTEAANPTHLGGDAILLKPGTYEFSFFAKRGGKTPGALVDVPAGYVEGDDGNDWYIVSEDGVVFLGLWTVGAVERDACRRTEHDQVTPGPTVEDLAEALVAQDSTDATEPDPVTLAGHDGLYLTLTGPGDLTGCDFYPALWREPGERGIYGDDQVDWLWILDADGQRIVVDASYGQTATQAQRNELTAMVESLQFVTATG